MKQKKQTAVQDTVLVDICYIVLFYNGRFKKGKRKQKKVEIVQALNREEGRKLIVQSKKGKNRKVLEIGGVVDTDILDDSEFSGTWGHGSQRDGGGEVECPPIGLKL